MPSVDKGCTTHHYACDCREARFAEMEKALRLLLQAQPENDPDLNDEYLQTAWVRQIAEDALREPDFDAPTSSPNLKGND